MKHQPISERVNGAVERAQGSYQPPSAPYHPPAPVPTQVAISKAASPAELTGAHLYLAYHKSGYGLHAFSSGMSIQVLNSNDILNYIWCYIR